MRQSRTFKITCTAICMALAMVLPFITGQIQQVGNMLCPMHLPVLICGFACGWPWGLAVGLIAPILRSLLFSMPPMFPIAAAMAFELAGYGALAGLFYKLMPKKIPYIYLSLLLSMAGGRIIWGIARFAFAKIQHGAFPFSAFLAGAITNALPGIALQIVLVPAIVIALRKAKFTE